MRLFSTYIICVLCLFLAQVSLASDSTAILYANAIEAQKNGKAQEAIQLYESILEGEMTSSSLYNNLGLAYIDNKQLGLGIVQFERALQVNPTNADAQHNLQAAQQRIEENFTAIRPLFFVQWWRSIRSLSGSTGWGILFILMLSLGAGEIGHWRAQNKTKSRTIGIVLFCLSILPLIWGFQQKAIELSNNQAIVIKTQVGLRQAPELSSEEIELIFEGVKVAILDEQDSWTHIQLPNNLIGWVPSQMLEQI